MSAEVARPSSFVMAGLVPAIHELQQPLVKIVPGWVCRQNKPHLPLPRPVLDVLLALNCGGDLKMRLEIDETLQSVPFRKALHQTFAMLPGPTNDVRRHP